MPEEVEAVHDPILDEIMSYHIATRQAFDQRQFDELERNADAARASMAQFRNGTWKIYEFYNALDCDPQEPESMWQLHENIHRSWIAAKPDSITARVGLMEFFTRYAWHARGNGFANTVTPEGWQLFSERLKQAQQLLNASRDKAASCPVWWLVGMRVALGQQWSRGDYDAFFAQAKAQEPTFWPIDVARSKYLSLKWYGQPGEWEAAAEAAAADPKGAGMETYTRCVLEQYANYRNNVYQESRAEWTKTQQGFALMEQRYPESSEVLRAHCLMACLAGDRPTAKLLFERLGDKIWSPIWGTREYLQHTRAWAESLQ